MKRRPLLVTAALFVALRAAAFADAGAPGTADAGAPDSADAGASGSADALVSRAIAAQGGYAAWSAVSSLRLRGSLSRFSTPQPFTLYLQRPNRYRFDQKLLEFDISLGHDGERAWWINTSMVSPVPWAVEPPPVYVRTIEAESEIGGPLLDFRARGHRVESKGEVDLEGERLIELVVSLRNGTVERWFLDPASHLPRTRLALRGDGPFEKPQRTDFYDYRQVEGGILLAHRLEIELGYNFEVMEVEAVEVNAEIAGEVFRMPLAEGMEALRGLAGHYRVSYQATPDPGVPLSETGELEVEVRSAHGGVLLEEELVYPMFATPRRIRRWRTWDRSSRLYRTAIFDSMTGHIDVLEGSFDAAGRLTTTDLPTGTSWTAGGRTYHTREVTYDIRPEGFRVDLETSLDGGETWTGKVSFEYKRLDRE